MKILFKSVLIFLIFSSIKIQVYAQSNTNINYEKGRFVSASIGYQMSGIKSEDFVRSNYSPLYKISIGKWFAQELALQVGYRGTYFYTISDDVKHHYNYLYGEAILDLNSIILRQESKPIYSILFHIGSGYLYNFTYGQPNIGASVNISNNLLLDENLIVKLDISSIMAWDIYQGDEDILPGLSIGMSYIF